MLEQLAKDGKEWLGYTEVWLRKDAFGLLNDDYLVPLWMAVDH